MSEQAAKTIRFGSSWSTQFRLTQAIGRGLAGLTPINATVVIGERGRAGLERGEVDLLFSKSVVNAHMASGAGLYAGPAPATWLRTIAWLPQDDRFLFAVAPWTGITSFEDIAAKHPPLKMAGQGGEAVLKAYGFSYDDITAWGGAVRRAGHTAQVAEELHAQGSLDAWFGDGSAYDGTNWRWLAEQGYLFLDVSEAAMQRLEAQGLRRHITPAGFLPGITRTLLALDDSHIVLTCHQRLDDELAYLLARVGDEQARDIEYESIQVTAGEDPVLSLLPRPSMWSSLTGHIERQWDPAVLGAPLHPGAERYYKERGVL